MKDTKLIDLVADIWINNDGDAEGFGWVWHKIQERIAFKKEVRDAGRKNVDFDFRLQ